MKKNKIKSNTFLFNVITLISGTAISQGITFAFIPLLTRYYTPGEFGIFALFIAIVGTISVVASWKYELAIMLPKKEEDAQALLFLSIVITVFTALLILLLIIIFKNLLIGISDKIETFYWLIPLGIFMAGLLQVFTAWNTRQEFIKNVSVSRIVQSSSIGASQISFKFLKYNSLGLILGNIIGTSIAVVVLIYEAIRKHTIRLNMLSKNGILSNLKQYDNFPKFQSFSVLINAFSQHLPVILLISLYSPVIAGFYSLTNRALNTPARLLGGSVRPIYYQHASKLYNDGKGIKDFFKKTTLGLIKMTILPYLIIGILAQKIFPVVFGSEWAISGIYAQLLILFIFTITINPPAVMSIQILGIQKFHLKYEILLAICRFFSIYLGYKIFNNHFVSIGLFSFVGILFNIFLIFYVYQKLIRREYSITK